MEVDIHTLRWEKEVGELKSALGVSLDELTAGELLALVNACELVCNPFSDCNAELVDRPVRLCRGVWLWRPTAGAQIWLDEYASKWFPKNGIRWKWAQVYALAHARDADAFAPLVTRWEAEKAIALFALRLPVHGAELQRGIELAYGRDEREVPRERTRNDELAEQAQTDFSALVARLEVESGIPRGEWLWGRSLVYTAKAYASLHEFAAAFSLGKGERTNRMRDELDDALSNLARVKSCITRRIRAERAKTAKEVHDGEGS